MASWVKKELAKLRIYKSNNRLLLPPLDTSPTMLPVEEVVLAADIGCATCQKRMVDEISRIEDIESVVVHVFEKKVTLARKSVTKGARPAPGWS
ncbi:hypothetical protein GH714_026739 [Hevea brasiliensis]|uniref:HMA domain-containing protein n=1 Tax=Hevea brasiliensis TaxID=3981 RepID=A0A6A6LBE5_HEVBR|nr:hypothetical protein GH714_026739 [Hevea brasiliensis]